MARKVMIAGGIVLLILGVTIYFVSSFVNSVQSNNMQQCNSFTGQLGQSLSQENAEICRGAPVYMSISGTGILLAIIISIIGIALIIIGAISGRRKKDYAQPKQQYDSLAQDRTRSQTQSLVPSNRHGKPIAENKNIGLETDLLKELERLGDLKQKGTITEEEFQKLKCI
jgi:uncharacterized membrane protein